MPARIILALALALVTQVRSSDAIHDALALGRSNDEAAYSAFNAGYKLPLGPILDDAEIITEFRRAVMIVHDHVIAQGEYTFGAEKLRPALAPYKGLVTFIVQVRLNPLNTYQKAPKYELYVATGPHTKPLVGKPYTRDPVYPVGSVPGGAMAAVRLEATFQRSDIESASAPALTLVDDQGLVIWTARLDLSRYR